MEIASAEGLEKGNRVDVFNPGFTASSPILVNTGNIINHNSKLFLTLIKRFQLPNFNYSLPIV